MKIYRLHFELKSSFLIRMMVRSSWEGAVFYTPNKYFRRELMKNNLMKKAGFILLILVLLPYSLFAHSGRTDSKGGHKDNKNQSGLGSYHYHCGGNPPHLHTNGVCPYKSVGSSVSSSSTASKSTNTQTNKKKYEDILVSFKFDEFYIDIHGISENGVNLVELRPLCENLNIDVAWDPANSKITCTKEDKIVTLTIGSKNVTINNENIVLQVAPKIVDGRTLIPARFIAEAIGKTVTYDNSDGVIEIK